MEVSCCERVSNHYFPLTRPQLERALHHPLVSISDHVHDRLSYNKFYPRPFFTVCFVVSFSIDVATILVKTPIGNPD